MYFCNIQCDSVLLCITRRVFLIYCLTRCDHALTQSFLINKIKPQYMHISLFSMHGQTRAGSFRCGDRWGVMAFDAKIGGSCARFSMRGSVGEAAEEGVDARVCGRAR